MLIPVHCMGSNMKCGLHVLLPLIQMNTAKGNQILDVVHCPESDSHERLWAELKPLQNTTLAVSYQDCLALAGTGEVNIFTELTDQEIEVLTSIARGLTILEFADELFISFSTIK